MDAVIARREKEKRREKKGKGQENWGKNGRNLVPFHATYVPDDSLLEEGTEKRVPPSMLASVANDFPPD